MVVAVCWLQLARSSVLAERRSALSDGERVLAARGRVLVVRRCVFALCRRVLAVRSCVLSHREYALIKAGACR